MPIRYREDEKPVVEFDPRLEISPFTLFRRLREGRAPLLVDVRPVPERLTLSGAEPLPGADWLPEEEVEVVVFDDDGSVAVGVAARLQQAGRPRVKALFGGLELYEFSLDPQVVGEETFLEPIPATS